MRARIANQRANPAIVRLWKAMRPLRSVASFLNTGAHPDDETTSMLAALAWRDGFRVAVACSTRGEGGQNNLGTERGADLGAIRTREMERAADELGLGVYWLSVSPEDPIADFGFSKSGEETFRYWGRERTVEAMVRILREERPDIVCPTFLDVPGQHGHHRAMTQAAEEAVALAAEPKAYPDQIAEGLAPWQVAKFYLPAWSGGGRSYDDTEPPPNATVTVESGDTDPVLGASYSQIAQWSRALHLSQGMGVWTPNAPKSWPLHLAIAGPGQSADEIAITDGLPRTLADLAPLAASPEMARLLEAASGAVDATLALWPNREAIAKTATVALEAVRAALAGLGAAEERAFGHRLRRKVRELSEVAALAAGAEIWLLPATDEVRPGETISIGIEFGDGIRPRVDLVAPEGWSGTRSESAFELSVPEDVKPSDPYPTRHEPGGTTAPVFGLAHYRIEDAEIEVPVPLERPFAVLPRHVVRLEPEAIVVNLAGPNSTPEVRIDVEGGGKPDLARKGGWTAESSATEGAFRLTRKSAPKAGLTNLAITVDGAPAATLMRSDYNHTGKVVRAAPAVLRLLALDCALPEGLRIGYAGGGADAVDRSLRAAGADVTSIGPDALARADFSAFDTVVIGIFAFGARPDLDDRLADLHDWVRAGGNLVTLYHRPWDNWSPETTPLARLEIGQPSLRWRVTDEAAKVKILTPKHPLLTGPNKIGAKDWAGWKKERGLYFASDWDAAYTPLIEMADEGEDAHRGALLSGEFGKGRHTHTSLILHHQMEQLVPGGFRIMANLVSAGRA